MKRENFTEKLICVIVGVCVATMVMLFFTTRQLNQVEANTSKIQESMAEDVLRFHILANSDSDGDQSVKLNVRDAVISYINENMGEVEDEEMAEAWISSHTDDIESCASEVLEDAGYNYEAKAKIVTDTFPQKRYGDVTFPKGTYRALRITLGEGAGHNWWCVLYPNLCFMDGTCSKVSEEGKEALSEVLSEDAYEYVTAATDFQIKWFFFGD